MHSSASGNAGHFFATEVVGNVLKTKDSPVRFLRLTQMC